MSESTKSDSPYDAFVQRLPRCFLSADAWRGDLFVLSEEESHHLLRVLRLKPGNRVEIFDGAGAHAVAELAVAAGKFAQLLPGPIFHEPDSSERWALIQGMPKPAKMDEIIQRATELGAHEICVVNGAHSDPGLKSKDVPRRLERWRAVAVSAAKQCGRNRLPLITAHDSVEAALRDRTQGALLVCSLRPGARPMRDVLRELPSNVSRVAVAVGPEGDFSGEEYDRFESAGARSVSLGKTVLRTETAAFYVLSALAYERSAFALTGS